MIAPDKSPHRIDKGLKNIRQYQAVYNSKGLGDLLVVDGVFGPKTARVYDLFGAAFMYGVGIHRVHWHWTGGSSRVNGPELDHYNYVIDGEGGIFRGSHSLIEQAGDYVGPFKGASHTRGGNTGALGIAVCGMLGASYSDKLVNVGEHPINELQIDILCRLTAQMCRTANIVPSKWTTLTHAEVGANLGLPQSGKWDIKVLPHKPSELLDASIVGDILREKVKSYG